MKAEVRVALVQFACSWLDPATNAARMAEYIEAEGQAGADLVVFPELSNTGYVEPHSDRDFARRLYEASEPLSAGTMALLQDSAARAGVHVVAGVSRRHERIPGLLYNSAWLIGPDGATIGVQDKLHACLDEKNYFAQGTAARVFDTGLGRIGLQVCYDVRFPEVGRLQALDGAELIVSVWASSVQPGKVPDNSIQVRCATRAMENALFFVGCNRSGVEGERHFYGRSAICDPSGATLASSDNDSEEVICASLRGDAILEQRSYLTVYRDRRPELYGPIAEV